jgi:hypothetical protein
MTFPATGSGTPSPVHFFKQQENMMNQSKIYLCPGSNAYWAIRATAFSLIALIEKNLSIMSAEEDGPYWTALQQARQNTTVADILRAQGREELLTPALGPILDAPEKSDQEKVADAFNLPLPIDLKALAEKADADGDDEMISYLYHLKESPSEFVPWTEKIMTADGIVRIVTESWDDEEMRFYRRHTYLNGQLHDLNGVPAVRESSYHRIPSEGHLDTDVEISYRSGVQVEYISHDDAVVARWSDGQRVAFGAADFDSVA